MTYTGFINPKQCKTVGELWAYVGLTPQNNKLKHGEQGKFNPHIKGRFWLIATNVIRALDKNDYPLYKIKKTTTEIDLISYGSKKRSREVGTGARILWPNVS